MRLDALDTPCLVLDRARLVANIARMRRHLDRLGGRLRPHVKTAKCVEVARLATAGQPVGAMLRILPNHAFATGAQFTRYHVVDGGREVTATWERFGGW